MSAVSTTVHVEGRADDPFHVFGALRRIERGHPDHPDRHQHGEERERVDAGRAAGEQPQPGERVKIVVAY